MQGILLVEINAGKTPQKKIGENVMENAFIKVIHAMEPVQTEPKSAGVNV